MNRDRGLIKWQPAHFMPEHRKLLNGVTCNDNKCKRPELDEQKLEEIGIVVMDSLNYTLLVNVATWQDGYFKNQIGVIYKVDPLMKYILLETNSGKEKIMINDITAVEK